MSCCYPDPWARNTNQPLTFGSSVAVAASMTSKRMMKAIWCGIKKCTASKQGTAVAAVDHSEGVDVGLYGNVSLCQRVRYSKPYELYRL